MSFCFSKGKMCLSANSVGACRYTACTEPQESCYYFTKQGLEQHDKELKTKIYADLYSIAVMAERQGGHISADYIKVKALQQGIEL